MHSRIFQISTEPILPDEYMSDSYFDYDHWFFHHIADSVADDEDREYSIRWLFETLAVGNGLLSIDGDSFLLHEGYHASYWDGRYSAFIRKAEALCALTASEFAQGGASMLLYQVGQLHEETSGFYAVARIGDYENLVTMDEFIRHAKVDTRYYIGGTVDYHA